MRTILYTPFADFYEISTEVYKISAATVNKLQPLLWGK